MQKNEELLNSIKIGDTVTLASTRPPNWNPRGLMDMFLGTEQIVKFVGSANIGFENLATHEWNFKKHEVEKVNGVSAYSNIELFPIY